MVEGTSSLFEYLEKFSLNFSRSSFVIRVNLRMLSYHCKYLLCFSFLGDFFRFLSVKDNIVRSQSNSKYHH